MQCIMKYTDLDDVSGPCLWRCHRPYAAYMSRTARALARQVALHQRLWVDCCRCRTALAPVRICEQMPWARTTSCL